ncbi:DUF5667 domain-containing protein [Streptomyces gamaensis]|uniref:DUF5667 domain-containing protein n=1 Tax=Streptomyces gamaensis TaxID=1763542 RepID=A0ABW0Z1M5_9ACTN
MIANVSAHRRANAFAAALEEKELQDPAAAQPGPAAHNAEQERLLTLAGGLGAIPAPELDPEVRTVQRAQLVAAMESLAAGGEGGVPEQRSGRGAHRALSRLRPRSRWSKGLAAGGLTVGVAAGAFGGVAAASAGALPGDTLYGLKRGMEDLRLGMADDDSARGGLLLDQAATRLQEARRLMERGRSGRLDHEELAEIRRTLFGMRRDVSEGHRLLHAAYERDGSLDPIQRLSSFAASHREGWSRLRDKLPVQLSQVGNEVSSVLKAIDDEVAPLSSLLTPHQDRHGSTPRHGTPHDGTGRTGRPTAPSTPPSASDGKRSADGQAHPSTSSGHDEHEGLLGGTGLLQPPSGSGSSAPAGPTHGGKEGKPSKQPDVTIPPLLPDLLPGLGFHGEEPK